jgi:hypothetical protein
MKPHVTVSPPVSSVIFRSRARRGVGNRCAAGRTTPALLAGTKAPRHSLSSSMEIRKLIDFLHFISGRPGL